MEPRIIARRKLEFIPGFHFWALLFAMFPTCEAQQTTSLSVSVTGPDGSAVSAATLTLRQPVSGFTSTRTTGDSGDFAFANVPLQDYLLTVSHTGFTTVEQRVSLRSAVPQTVKIQLTIESRQESLDVTAFATADLIDVEATGTRTSLNLDQTKSLPIPIGTRGLEAVLLSFPGFAANANGAIHPRGAHNQMTYVIDGLPISDQLTGSFASALDPAIAQSLELFTGNIPAEYGSKVSGVASIVTRSGIGSGRRAFGQVAINAAQFDTLSHTTQAGGELGRIGWFVATSSLKTHRFLDSVSLANLHNGGNSERAFARLDYQASPADSIQFNIMVGRSSFELANLPSQQIAGQRQRQLLNDGALWLHWTRALTASSAIEATAAYRSSITQLFSSPGDAPITADQARHLSTLTLNTRYSLIAGSHRVRIGADWQHIPVSEAFSFGITDAAWNAPSSPGYRLSLAPFDLTRGGSRFYFARAASGDLLSGFAQDEITRGWLSLSFGLRYDAYRFLVHGAQWQPRVGIAVHSSRTGTVLRASYNRNYQTPPNENLLLSDSPEAAALAPDSVRQKLGSARIPIRPERQDVYEAGLQQSLFGRASLNLAVYHKQSTDQQDNDNFLNTGIIFPVTLARIRVNGVEGRLVLPPVKWGANRLQSTFSATHARAVSTPPFTGGLFLNTGAVDLLTSGPFVIDHDQKLSLQSNTVYSAGKSWTFSAGLRYDSGLVVNRSDPAAVAADPDYANLLPYVNLTAAVPRTLPRAILDTAIGYTHFADSGPDWDLQLQANNLSDKTALYNFQSIFVGTRVVAPRVIGARLRLYF